MHFPTVQRARSWYEGDLDGLGSSRDYVVKMTFRYQGRKPTEEGFFEKVEREIGCALVPGLAKFVAARELVGWGIMGGARKMLKGARCDGARWEGVDDLKDYWESGSDDDEDGRDDFLPIITTTVQTPNSPNTPIIPITPNTPITPITPPTPVTPVTPNTPNTPNTPTHISPAPLISRSLNLLVLGTLDHPIRFTRTPFSLPTSLEAALHTHTTLYLHHSILHHDISYQNILGTLPYPFPTPLALQYIHGENAPLHCEDV